VIEDLAALVAIASPTGDERPALEWVVARAGELGLRARLVSEDLAATRAAVGWPGEEVARSELLGAEVVRGDGARRLALCAHVDVVGEGSEPWSHARGDVEGGYVWGRGSADMKAGVVAALHAIARARPAADAQVTLLAVSSEEDGGQGAFAALERDAAYDACVIPEPTGFDVVCAQAGALTFSGVVRGRAAHAALRLEGASAIDRYVPVHEAIAAYERALNADVAHPLMRELELPYPVAVGRVRAGAWSSSVPDRLEFEGRLALRVGEEPAAARAAFAAALGERAELAWTGGQFASADTPPDARIARIAAAAVDEVTGGPAHVTGVPWGADMRLFTARGIPTVMVGTGGLERGHAVDERVAVADVEALTRVLERVIERF
jgi:acetylornithine deacetylase